MKRLFTYCILLSACAAFAQDDMKIDELRPPSSPGFTILGVQPTDISRPKSWRELETNVSSSFFQDNKVVIPKNFAMEFNPFFTIGTQGSSYDPAYIYDNNPDFWKTVKYNTAISVATGEFKTYRDTSQRNPRMGIGLRTQLVDFKPTAAAQASYDQLKQDQRAVNSIVFCLESMKSTAVTLGGTVTIVQVQTDLATVAANASDLQRCLHILRYLEPEMTAVSMLNVSRADYINELEQIVLNYTDDKEYQKNRLQVEEGMDNRYGFCIELASAMLVDFPTNDIAFSRVPKFGFWGTYTYRSENQFWEVAALTRFVTSKFDTIKRHNNFDLGFRGMLANEKWSINAEYVQRVQFNLVGNKPVGNGTNEATFRYTLDFKLALTVNYKLTDDVIVNYTFGNNLYINTEFEDETKNLNSNIGLVCAFGGPRVKDVLR